MKQFFRYIDYQLWRKSWW